MNPYFLYLLLPAIIASVNGVILCCLAIRGRPVLGAVAAVAAASPWLYFAIVANPDFLYWRHWRLILLFSVCGPGVLFGGVMAAVALSKDENKRRKTSLLWVSAVGLIATTLYALASWFYAVASI
ncbi:MAG: hypothetical protein V4819_18385 [Verrucomicrobiota bacterium]